MSHSLPSRQLLRAARTTCLALLAGCFFLLAPSALGATLTLAGTDPTDAKNPKIDLTSAKVSYDPAAGKATVALQTIESNATFVGFDVYVVLTQAAGGKCEPQPDVSTLFAFSLSWKPELTQTKWFVNTSEQPGEAATQRTGTTLTTSAGPSDSLKNLKLDCALVQMNTADAGDAVDVDFMTIFAPGAGGADKDKDGVPDSSDKCPTVAGGDRYGCLTISAKQAVRLGAKRVAIDKMVARTGNACPVKANVAVKSGKKKVGSGVVSVTSHGSFCRVYGVVKLKKSVKKAKITVKATGMGSIAASRTR